MSRSERLACSSEIMAAYLPQNRPYYQSPLIRHQPGPADRLADHPDRLLNRPTL
jgi:hypothetical protein